MAYDCDNTQPRDRDRVCKGPFLPFVLKIMYLEEIFAPSATCRPVSGNAVLFSIGSNQDATFKRMPTADDRPCADFVHFCRF